MLRVKRAISLLLMLCLLTPAAHAAKAKPTATPAPRATSPEIVQEVPEKIQQLLDLAYNEYTTLNGKQLRKVNKYTEWRGKGVGFGWCAGFVTWCMLQLDVPQERMADMKEEPRTGIQHVMEASVGKLLRGYQKMGRTTDVPQKGFLLVYAVRRTQNMTTHVGLVWDVQDLGNGKYRITTIEGNMSSRIKMYVHDYDRFAADRTRNLKVIPEAERTRKEDASFNYRMQMDTWYVNTFLMPWVPEEYMQPTATPVPAATLTPAPVMTAVPTPTLAPTPMPTPAPTPFSTAELDFTLEDIILD